MYLHHKGVTVSSSSIWMKSTGSSEVSKAILTIEILSDIKMRRIQETTHRRH